MVNLENLESLLAQGKDSAMLRFGLGKGYLDKGDALNAVAHLTKCVEQDANYSAAWKLLGKAQSALGEQQQAQLAWERGILAAQRGGDLQSVKEMTVFLRRITHNS